MRGYVLVLVFGLLQSGTVAEDCPAGQVKQLEWFRHENVTCAPFVLTCCDNADRLSSSEYGVEIDDWDTNEKTSQYCLEQCETQNATYSVLLEKSTFSSARCVCYSDCQIREGSDCPICGHYQRRYHLFQKMNASTAPCVACPAGSLALLTPGNTYKTCVACAENTTALSAADGMRCV